jgi:hypothetical protein
MAKYKLTKKAVEDLSDIWNFLTMKNLICLTSFLIILASLNCTCTKIDRSSDTTVSNLAGNWIFKNLFFRGNNYLNCNPALSSYSLTSFDIYGLAGNTLKIMDNCTSQLKTYPFYIDDYLIFVFPNSSTTNELYALRILEPEQFDGKTLKLEFISMADTNYICPLGGIYTFTKE